MAKKENNLVKKLKYRNYEMYKYFNKALEILSLLNEKTYEAYIVGGAVRDLYLNMDFNDIDIATNATPQTIKSLFSNCDVDMQYEHLGSVILKIDGFKYEITTFRSEEYVKHRLKSVHYSKKLIEDVQRRDFSINALAMTLNQEIIDLVKGQKDIEKKTIRIIGKANNRFKDDPSRILRGFHLVSKLNFKIDLKTEHAMVKNRALLSDLSNYKIITLLKKILTEQYKDVAIKKMKSTNIFKDMPKYSLWMKILSKYRKLNYIEQFTILFKLLGEIPINTGFSHKEIVEIKKLYELSDYMVANEITPIDIIQLGFDNLLQADNIACALNKSYISQSKKIKKLNKKMPIHSARELKISVDEIKALLDGDNSKIGFITSELLLLVVNGIIKNKYSALEEATMMIIEGKDKSYEIHENINPYVDQVEDNERIIALLEQNKENQGKVGVIEDAEYTEPELIAKNEEIIDVENNDKMTEPELIENVKISLQPEEKDFQIPLMQKDENSSSNDDKLLQMYYEDFNELYRIHRKSVFDELVVSELNEEEIEKHEIRIKEDVRKILIEKNRNYKDLNDRGII